jgi:hypothetical protein
MIYYRKYIFSFATKMSIKKPDPAGSVINLPPGSSGSVTQDYGSVPKEIFTDPQYCSPALIPVPLWCFIATHVCTKRHDYYPILLVYLVYFELLKTRI